MTPTGNPTDRMGMVDTLLQGLSSQPPAPGTVPIKREEGIGWPTIGALGALALGVAAARRPGVRRVLEEGWQKPLGFAERWTRGRPVEVGYVGKPGLPSELPILHRRPESQLVSDTERIGANVAKRTQELLGRPYAKDVLKQDPEHIKNIEEAQVAGFLTRMATGMTPIQAKTQVLAGGPSWFREADQFRTSMLREEQWAKRYMGMERIPERLGPYFPRTTIDDDIINLRGKGGMFGELRTSLAGAERERRYPTMRAGEQAGVKYDDPRVAFLNREVNAIRLVETAKYMQRLEGRVIFRDKLQAQQIANNARVYELKAFPGAPSWWVPFKEEAKFLQDNLTDPEWGKLGFIRNWSNTMARNPNLINPLPHIVKNMAYKYRLAGGKLSQLPADWMEFRRGTSPMVMLFKRAMPFDETGQTGAQMFQRAVHAVRREDYPAPVRLADLALDKIMGLNRFSSRVIFAQADPAMRYSLWKQYVQKGMHPNEAAQNVWIDLIRYGTRSTVVDAWKSIPFNFFVPWRLGTVTSVYKQLTDHPLRATAVIGAIELLREMRYRQTGQWTHLPIDYIEAPIAQVLQSKDPTDAAKSLIAATLATIAFGPGGGFAAATLKDLMEDIQMRGDWGRLRNVFWGLSQMYEMPTHGYRTLQALQRGDGAAAASEASKILTSAVMAEHTALNYRPRRLLAALPEVGPWLQKSVQVKLAEQMQQSAEMRGERAQQRRERRKGRGDISERVRTLTEPVPEPD